MYVAGVHERTDDCHDPLVEAVRFGEYIQGGHNIGQSKAMQVESQRIGIHDTPSGREYVSNYFNEIIKDPTNISNVQVKSYEVKELPDRPVVEYTATTRESLLMGPGGAIKLESIWDGDRLLTVIIKGGKKK